MKSSTFLPICTASKLALWLPTFRKTDRLSAMTFSLFGDKFTRHSGITRLMEDLNDGLRTPGAIMLGGGNPAQIPEMNEYFQTLLADMLANGKALDALCNYDGPQGKSELLTVLAQMLREELGWEIEPQNIALTNGSQSAFSTCLTSLPDAVRMAPPAKSCSR